MQGISLVICCHNSERRIVETLQHIMQQKVAENINWEMVLIDNASTDHTAEIAKQIWNSSIPFKVVTEPKLGVGHARNRGFRESAHEIICFVDDDNHLSPDWVETVYRKMEQHPDAGAIGGLNLEDCEIAPPAWFSPYKACYAAGPQSAGEGELIQDNLVLWSAGIAIRRSAWEDLNRAGFKSILVGRTGKVLSSGEDSEICYLLRILGWKLYFFPSLTLKHFIPKEKLTWNYLCQLKRGFGAASLPLMMYRRIYQYRRTGTRQQTNPWWQEILRDTWAVMKQPAVLGATLFNLYEGNNHILNMHALLGRLAERLRLLQRIDAIEKTLWKKYADLPMRESDGDHYSAP